MEVVCCWQAGDPWQQQAALGAGAPGAPQQAGLARQQAPLQQQATIEYDKRPRPVHFTPYTHEDYVQRNYDTKTQKGYWALGSLGLGDEDQELLVSAFVGTLFQPLRVTGSQADLCGLLLGCWQAAGLVSLLPAHLGPASWGSAVGCVSSCVVCKGSLGPPAASVQPGGHRAMLPVPALKANTY